MCVCVCFLTADTLDEAVTTATQIIWPSLDLLAGEYLPPAILYTRTTKHGSPSYPLCYKRQSVITTHRRKSSIPFWWPNAFKPCPTSVWLYHSDLQIWTPNPVHHCSLQEWHASSTARLCSPFAGTVHVPSLNNPRPFISTHARLHLKVSLNHSSPHLFPPSTKSCGRFADTSGLTPYPLSSLLVHLYLQIWWKLCFPFSLAAQVLSGQ